jgi:hypothetical protein
MKISPSSMTFCLPHYSPRTLFDAATAGNRDEIKAILAADPAATERPDSRGERPLHYAAAGGATLTVSYSSTAAGCEPVLRA